MTTTYEFETEQQARAFWHHLLNQMGFERFASNCSIRFEKAVHIITVTHA